MYSSILVPVDGSATAALGVAEAIKLAKNQDATVRVIHIVNELIVMGSNDAAYGLALVESLRQNGKTVLKDAEALVSAAGIKVDSILIEAMGDHAGHFIVQQAKEWNADLIVMGTHGRRRLRRMVMGSDAEFVVRNTPVPVLLIRPATEHPQKTEHEGDDREHRSLSTSPFTPCRSMSPVGSDYVGS
ncbi:MAG: universal stress protein [Steroidobacteraceae bacterium]